MLGRAPAGRASDAQPNVAGARHRRRVGGILGHQVGGGTGNAVATVGGAVGGAAVGANVDRPTRRTSTPATCAVAKRGASGPAAVLGRDLQLPRRRAPCADGDAAGTHHHGQCATANRAADRASTPVGSRRPVAPLPAVLAAGRRRLSNMKPGSGERRRRRYCAPMSAPVFVKLFAIFAVVAIGWLVGSAAAGSAAADPARDALRRGVLHLRSGAALSHHRAHRLPHARRADPARLLRPDAGCWSASSTWRCAAPAGARRGRPPSRACARSLPRSATRCRSASRSPPRCSANRPGAAHHHRQPALADAADRADRAGRARPRARAAARRSAQRAAGAHAGDDGGNTIIHPVVLPVLAGLAWNLSGFAAARRRRRNPGHARPGGRAALPGADRRVARPLRRARRHARRGRAVGAEARRCTAARARRRARRASA